jgi:hypothetical protein
MKKLLLFVSLTAMALSLNSCSDDDSSSDGGNGGSLTMKLNGISKTYNTVTVSATPDGEGGTYLMVTGSPDGSSSEKISFVVMQGDLGSDVAYNADLTVNGDTTYFGSMNSNILVNTENATGKTNQLKGTFSGKITEWNNDTQVEDTVYTVTDGAFDVKYK